MAYNDKKNAKLTSAYRKKKALSLYWLDRNIIKAEFIILWLTNAFSFTNTVFVETDAACAAQRSGFWPTKLCTHESQNVSPNPFVLVALSGSR